MYLTPRNAVRNKGWGCLAMASLISMVTALSFAITDGPAPMPGQPQALQPGPGGDNGPGVRRTPPKAAVTACDGKKEGDPCTFIGANGASMTGECLSGRENIFACRPHRREMQGEPVREPASERQPDVPRETNALPAAASKNKATATPETKPSVVSRPAESAPSPAVQVAAPKQQAPAVNPDPTAQQAASEPSSWGDKAALGFAGVLVGGVLTWYGFFRYSTMPLRRLRTVTQQLAGGNLSARIGEGLVHRKDEVADLARDVDRMAERIESLVGSHQRLIRDVSHELRSPLARLNVALELARQSAGVGNSAPFDRIERESDRLNELIGQLLMLTRLENESAMGEKTEVDLSGLIREIAHDADFEAKGNDRGVTSSAQGLLMVRGNRELLRQAIENLVRNAVRYTEAGTAVEISLKKKLVGGREWAHVEVLDHGPGVPESELFNIFRPFYRVGDSRERQSGGTGVGLAIADRAVRLHGGSLRALNAPGAGLVMEMELPL